MNDDSSNNDWTTSGVMHYLNDPTAKSYYTTQLSSEAKGMIQETTYYLGNVGGNTSTVNDYYQQERGSVVCDSTITSSSHNSSCNIWSGNQASWTGDVALIYLSDFLYTISTEVWNMSQIADQSQFLKAMRESWMSNTEAVGYWLLSPSSNHPLYVWNWRYYGSIDLNDAYNDSGLRPSLNLKSDVMVVSGDGSYSSPYKLLG